MFKLKFLGTGGARFVVMRQLRHSGGLYLITDKLRIHIDPGPGALVRMLSSRPKLDPTKTDAVILTHKHLDHSNDVNIILEALTQGGFYKRGTLMAPRDALEGDPPVLQFVRQYIAEVLTLEKGLCWEREGIEVMCPLELRHGVENYAVRVKYNGLEMTLVSDTVFFEDLVDISRTDCLVVNVLLTEPRQGIMHLCVDDLRRLLTGARQRVAIMTHFGMRMIQAKPWVIAEKLSDETGVRVVAARDGMEFDIVAELSGSGREKVEA